MYRLSCKYMIPKNISLNGETVLVTGAVGFIPRTSLQYGLRNFAKWYAENFEKWHAENFIQCK